MTDLLPAKKRPTQNDVARRAGVSQTVVSMVLNDRAQVTIAAETRQRVLTAIDELGYVPNGSARSLRTQKSLLIASLIPDIANPFYPAFERGIQDIADSRGYDLTAYNTDELREKELRSIRSVLRARVDGVVATPFQVGPEDFAPLLHSGVPVVVFGELTVAAPELPIDFIYVDDRTATRELLHYLLSAGLTPLAMITGAGTSLRQDWRVQAYQEQSQTGELGHVAMMVRGPDHTEAGGYAAMQQLLVGSPRPRAVFATNDMMAIGAMVAIRDAGLRVPEDIAVAGYDDITVARLLNPPLTTVAQFPERLGRRAAELLFERLSGAAAGEGRRVEMPHELRIRASA
jgi:LacI family transcriptional regulator